MWVPDLSSSISGFTIACQIVGEVYFLQCLSSHMSRVMTNKIARDGADSLSFRLAPNPCCASDYLP